MRPAAELDLPWTRTAPAALVRDVLVCGVLGAAMDLYTRREISGLAALEALDGPVIVVANHNSHMDTPLLLRLLPGSIRRRTAVAAAKDYFFTKPRNAISSSLVFATTPLDRSGGGLSQEASGHLDAHLDRGGCLLMFAEGTRTGGQTVGELKSGAAVLAVRNGVPIVPVFVDGTARAMPTGRKWMVFRHGRPLAERHCLHIRVGAPISTGQGDDPRVVMDRVAAFLESRGGSVVAAEPDRVPERHAASA